MRSYWAKSFIQTITPSLDITLFGVILATILLMSFALQFNHRKELKQIVKYGSILIGIGVLIIFMGYTSLMDSLKYTEGGKKVTAQITNVHIEHVTDGSDEFEYIIAFPYGGEMFSVRLIANHDWKLSQGAPLDVYFYPEMLKSSIGPIVVAVDLEVDLARKNMLIGILPCMVGLFILFYAHLKEKIIIKGIRICAKVVKISDVSSEEPLCKLVCQGKSITTGRPQIFETRGKFCDFTMEEGDLVHVYVHQSIPSLYTIDL